SQLSSVNWKPKVVSLLVAVTEPSFQSGLGAAANNVTGPSQWESAVNYTPALAATQGFTWFGPSSADFTTLYKSIHSGLAPTYHSGEAAGSLLILVKAIETANSLNTTAVRQALAQMKVMTFFGGFQVDSTGLQIAHTMVLVQWQVGQLKVVQPANVAQSSVRYPYLPYGGRLREIWGDYGGPRPRRGGPRRRPHAGLRLRRDRAWPERDLGGHEGRQRRPRGIHHVGRVRRVLSERLSRVQPGPQRPGRCCDWNRGRFPFLFRIAPSRTPRQGHDHARNRDGDIGRDVRFEPHPQQRCARDLQRR